MRSNSRPIKSPLGRYSSRSAMGRSSDFPPCCLGKIRRRISTDYLSSHTSGGTASDACWSNTALFLLGRKGPPPFMWSGIRTRKGFTGRVASRCSEPSIPALASACHSDERCSPLDPVTDNLETARGAERPRVDIDLRHGVANRAIPPVSQTDDEVNGSHGAVRDRCAGDEAREQIADWLSMYEAAVRSSGAGRGERQGEISCSLRAG